LNNQIILDENSLNLQELMSFKSIGSSLASGVSTVYDTGKGLVKSGTQLAGSAVSSINKAATPH
jgi:hypothetical protein